MFSKCFNEVFHLTDVYLSVSCFQVLLVWFKTNQVISFKNRSDWSEVKLKSMTAEVRVGVESGASLPHKQSLVQFYFQFTTK